MPKGLQGFQKGNKYPMGSFKNKGDNRIKNLKLFANTGKHTNHHTFLRRIYPKKAKSKLEHSNT